MDTQCVQLAIEMAGQFTSKIDLFLNALGVISTLFFLILAAIVYEYVRERRESRRLVNQIREDAAAIAQVREKTNKILPELARIAESLPQIKNREILQREIQELKQQLGLIAKQTPAPILGYVNGGTYLSPTQLTNISQIPVGTSVVSGTSINDLGQTLNNIQGTVDSILSERIKRELEKE